MLDSSTLSKGACIEKSTAGGAESGTPTPPQSESLIILSGHTLVGPIKRVQGTELQVAAVPINAVIGSQEERKGMEHARIYTLNHILIQATVQLYSTQLHNQ